MSLPSEDLPEKLLAQREITASGCWEWTGHRDENGYGRIRWYGRMNRVHRLAAHFVHGLDLADPSTMARHKCDNPPCFNPDHIEPGTAADNARDSSERGRMARKICRARLHPMAEDNIVWVSGHRLCRACRVAWSARRTEERRAHRLVNPARKGAKGLENGKGRFSDDEIGAMRRASDAGETYKHIALRFGADTSYVWRIVNGHRRAS